MLDVHRLRLLRELDRRGTLAAVARALSYSPSAISQQLSQLEAETGVRAARAGRARRPAHPAGADPGRAHRGDPGAARGGGGRRCAPRSTEVRGTLRVASFQSVLLALVPSVLTAARRAASGAARRDHPPGGGPGVRGPARARLRRRARRGVPGHRPPAGARRPHPAARASTSCSS